MFKKRLRIMLLWILIGMSAVLIRRIKYYGFTYDVFTGDLKVDLIAGLGTAIVFGLFIGIKKTNSYKH